MSEIENAMYGAVFLNVKSCTDALTLDQLALFGMRALQGLDCSHYSWYPLVKDCYDGGMTPTHLSSLAQNALNQVLSMRLPEPEIPFDADEYKRFLREKGTRTPLLKEQPNDE